MWKTYSIILTILIVSIARANVVVSIPDFKSIVERIYGEEVESVAPANTDPHLFSLTSEDLEKVKNAKLLILANSKIIGFEEEIKNLNQNTLDFEDYKVEILSFPGIGKNYHAYWLLPENTIKIASKVKEKLSEIYPEKKQFYERNFEKFVSSMQVAMRDSEKIVNPVKNYEFVAMDPHTAYAISALNLNVIFAFPEEVTPGAIELKNLSNNCVVAIAEYQKGTKIEEMALKIAQEKNCGVAVLKVLSDISPESMLISNAVILSNIRQVEREDNLAYIFAFIAAIEAILILWLWRLK